MNTLDRRTQKTRKAINEAFIGLLQEKHFEKITVQDITKAADIHRATFYLHYQDKYDCLRSCMKETLCINLRISDYSPSNKDVIWQTVQRCDENFVLLSTVLKNIGSVYFKESYIDLLLDYYQIKYGDIKNTDSRTSLGIQFNAAALTGIIEWWIRNKRPVSCEKLVELMWEIYSGFPDYLKL